MKQIISIIALLGVFSGSWGQSSQKSPRIGATSKPLPDKSGIELKWFPSNAYLWTKGLEYGYYISRKVTFEHGKSVNNSVFERITPVPLTPISKEELIAKIDSSEAMKGAVIAVEGDLEDFKNSADDPLKALDEYKQVEYLYVITSLACHLNKHVAQAAGMYFIDRKVEPGKRYTYQIEVANYKGDFKKALLNVDLSKKYTLPQPFDVDGKTKEHSAYLEWRYNYGGFEFAYYNIYRSEKENASYVKLNSLPYLANTGELDLDDDMAYYTDSLPQLGKAYYYQIKGVDQFGEESKASIPLKLTGLRQLHAGPQFEAESKVNEQTWQVDLVWTMPEAERSYVDHYELERAGKNFGEYQLLVPNLSADVTTFKDETPISSNYYRLCAVGKAGDRRCTLPLMMLMPDSIPPLAPKGLKGTVDTNGVVNISWLNNSEADLSGYRVFRGNDKYGEMSCLTRYEITDTTYIDTINVKLAYEAIYYCVFALDEHDNPSVFSDTLVLKRPDFLAPGAPVFRNFGSTKEGIRLKWDNSSSRDVVKQELYRLAPGDIKFRLIKTFHNNALKTDEYLDTDVEGGQYYKYKIIAVDDAGLRSPESPLVGVAQKKNMILPAIETFEAIISRPNKMVKLKWSYDYKDIRYFMLYRQTGNGGLRFYKRLPGNTREYYERNLRPNEKYSYKIMAEFKNGTNSAVSDEVQIQY